MNLSLSQLESGPQTVHFQTECLKLKDRFGLVVMQATAHVTPVEQGFKLKGSYKASFGFCCDRCTQEKQSEFTRDLELVLEPEQVETAEDLEFLSSIPDTEFYQGHEIHLSSIFEDQLILDLPMQLLCHPECKGLCDRCGGDLNMGTCRCDKINPNSPFVGLKDLMN